MSKRDGSDSSAPQFEGYCVDLCRELASVLGFNFTFFVTQDGDRGRFDVDQQRWTGMIGDLLEQASTYVE